MGVVVSRKVCSQEIKDRIYELHLAKCKSNEIKGAIIREFKTELNNKQICNIFGKMKRNNVKPKKKKEIKVEEPIVEEFTYPAFIQEVLVSEALDDSQKITQLKTYLELD